METQRKHGRRAGVRYRAGIPVVLHFGDREYPGAGTNLSRRGVQVFGVFPACDDRELRVVLSSGEGGLSLGLSARVANTGTDPESGEARLGLEFLEVTEEARDVLDALMARMVEGIGTTLLDSLPDKATPEEVIRALERIPLSRRIMLAKRGSPTQRAHLLLDPKPTVLDGLARNPQLTPAEIKQLARLRQLLPSTVDLIAEDPRWADDDELKVIIVTHPRATLKVALAVAKRLGPLAARKVLHSPGLNPAIRKSLLVQSTERQRRGF